MTSESNHHPSLSLTPEIQILRLKISVGYLWVFEFKFTNFLKLDFRVELCHQFYCFAHFFEAIKYELLLSSLTSLWMYLCLILAECKHFVLNYLGLDLKFASGLWVHFYFQFS